MLQRTTVVFSPIIKARAKARAREEGISFGEYVRRVVEKDLAHTKRRKGKKTGDPFWDNLVIYDDPDGPTDASVRHDDYIYGDWP